MTSMRENPGPAAETASSTQPSSGIPSSHVSKPMKPSSTRSWVFGRTGWAAHPHLS
jgi:hypothetical protein